ncbi:MULTISPECIES: hypothetical protein [Bacillus cereus group]|uniref:hypothetical protein n=1 Tax=Bacillus cereus TaxID=1396 RepID=UPI0021570AD4
MDFNGIMGNLIASAIYTLLGIIVFWIFRNPNKKSKMFITTTNSIKHVQIINLPPKVTEIRNVNSRGLSNEWIIIPIIASLILTYLSLVYRSEIINFGYITFSFGLIISILIIYGVNKVATLQELPWKDKMGLFFPIVYWCIFLIINMNLDSPIISDANINNVEQVIVNGGWNGLFGRFFNILSTNHPEFMTITLKVVGIGLLYLTLISTIKFQLFFVLNWVVNVKNNGEVNGFIMWCYKRTFIYKFNSYILGIVFALLFSFIFINGFPYLVIPDLNKVTLIMFQGI